MYTLNELAKDIHENENKKWWFDEDGKPNVHSSKERRLLLIHSEISEAAEGLRKNQMDSHLPNRTAEEVELADALIRILDYAAGYGLDLDGAVKEKREYNKARQDHKKESRESANGKTW